MADGYRVVNLEEGKPLVKQAIWLLNREIETSRKLGFAALKIIHGYGSSGSGGRLRVELRKVLAAKRASRQIADFIPGENFEIFNAATQKLLLKCSQAGKDRDLNRANNGVTVIIL